MTSFLGWECYLVGHVKCLQSLQHFKCCKGFISFLYCRNCGSEREARETEPVASSQSARKISKLNYQLGTHGSQHHTPLWKEWRVVWTALSPLWSQSPLLTRIMQYTHLINVSCYRNIQVNRILSHLYKCHSPVLKADYQVVVPRSTQGHGHSDLTIQICHHRSHWEPWHTPDSSRKSLEPVPLDSQRGLDTAHAHTHNIVDFDRLVGDTRAGRIRQGRGSHWLHSYPGECVLWPAGWRTAGQRWWHQQESTAHQGFSKIKFLIA